MKKNCNICGSIMSTYSKGERYTYFRCEKCGFFDTCSNSDQVKFDYDEYTTFDMNLEKYEINVKEAVEILKIKFQILGHTPKSFLDIGCSEGIWVSAFKNGFGEVSSGIEVSGSKILRAQNRGLSVGTFEDIVGKYEFVLLRHVIEHVDNPKQFLEMILDKYVSDDGVLWIETPNNDSISNRKKGKVITEDRFCRDLFPPTHICGFTPKTFKKMFGKRLLFMTTVSNGDSNWYYEKEKMCKEKTIKDRIYTLLNLHGTICVVVKKTN